MGFVRERPVTVQLCLAFAKFSADIVSLIPFLTVFLSVLLPPYFSPVFLTVFHSAVFLEI